MHAYTIHARSRSFCASHVYKVQRTIRNGRAKRSNLRIIFRSACHRGATHWHHTASLYPVIRRFSVRMTLKGSGGDSFGSVASCPGLRVQYW